MFHLKIDYYFMEYLQLIGGLILLICSGNYLVESASDIARKFKLSSLVIGLTIVSFGTSAPELLVSTNASLNGHPEIALGNVFGSNIVNIGFIMGLTSLLLPFAVNRDSIKIDVKVMLAFSIAALFFASDGNFSRIEGLLLFTVLVAYTIWLIVKSRKTASDEVVEAPKRNILVNVIILAASLAGLAFGSDFMVEGASTIAKNFGISEKVISITVVAIGTSLPELTASIISVIKKEVGMTIGNVIGSNTFNIGAVLGISSLISPIEFDFLTFRNDICWALAFGVLLLIGMINVTRNVDLMRSSGKISALWNAGHGEIGRIWGGCCLAAYVAYSILLFI